MVVRFYSLSLLRIWIALNPIYVSYMSTHGALLAFQYPFPPGCFSGTFRVARPNTFPGPGRLKGTAGTGEIASLWTSILIPPLCCYTYRHGLLIGSCYLSLVQCAVIPVLFPAFAALYSPLLTTSESLLGIVTRFAFQQCGYVPHVLAHKLLSSTRMC